MQDFAKAFYASKAWRTVRAYIVKRDFGVCCRCGKPGEIVHHKTYLTPQNINNPDVTLNVDNLELLCRDCHACEHLGVLPTAPELAFDADGNIIERSEPLS